MEGPLSPTDPEMIRKLEEAFPGLAEDAEPEPVMLQTLLDGATDVRRLELRPGDIIVLRLPAGRRVTDYMVDDLIRSARERFPGHECLVLGPGLDIGVMGPQT